MPPPASSNATGRGGDRDANCALYLIALTRLATDEDTKLYMKRRLAEGKTKKEVFRCLKRYIAREVHQAEDASQLYSLTFSLGRGVRTDYPDVAFVIDASRFL
jgi:hypothetical protein